MENLVEIAKNLALPTGLGALILLCYFSLIKPIVQNLEKKEKEKSRPGISPNQSEELQLPPKKMSDQEKMSLLAKSDPDKAKDLIRQWLREDQ